jgi:hypothetical protein
VADRYVYRVEFRVSAQNHFSRPIRDAIPSANRVTRQ